MGIAARGAIKAMSSVERKRAAMAIESHVHARLLAAIRLEYERVAEELRSLGYDVVQSEACLIDYLEQPDSDGERLYLQALTHVLPKVYFGRREEGDPDFQSEYNRIVESVQAEMDLCRRKSIDLGYDRLTDREKRLCVIADLIAEVNNGGFEQYLTNRSGRHFGDVIRACAEIDAGKTRALIENVGRMLREAGLLADHSNIDDIVSRPKVTRSLRGFDKRFLSLNEHIHYLCRSR